MKRSCEILRIPRRTGQLPILCSADKQLVDFLNFLQFGKLKIKFICLWKSCILSSLISCKENVFPFGLKVRKRCLFGYESLLIFLQLDCVDKLQRDLMYKLPSETHVSTGIHLGNIEGFGMWCHIAPLNFDIDNRTVIFIKSYQYSSNCLHPSLPVDICQPDNLEGIEISC